MAGLTAATAGSVRVRGQVIEGPQDDFGFVFQTPNLLPWRTVLDNVLFPMEIKGRRDAQGARSGRSNCSISSGCRASRAADRTSSPAE